jgi:hypothetical protein
MADSLQRNITDEISECRYSSRADISHLGCDQNPVGRPFGKDGAKDVEHRRDVVSQREVDAFGPNGDREPAVADGEIVCVAGACEKVTQGRVENASSLHARPSSSGASGSRPSDS